MASIKFILSVLALVALANGGSIRKSPSNKLHSVPLTQRGVHFGTISLGSNNQVFRVVFETAEAFSWVPSAKCNKTNISCQRNNQYDALASSTSIETHQQFEIDFQPSGKVQGNFVYDSLTLSDLTIPTYQFGEAVKEPLMFDTQIIEGFFGLGPNSGSNTTDRTSIMECLFLQGLIDDSFIGIYLSKDEHKSGEIVFGGYNQDHINSSINFVNSSSNHTWLVKPDSVSFDDLELSTGYTVLASGSLTISGPYQDIAKIHEKINAVIREDGVYLVDCSKVSEFPTLSFEIGNVWYNLTAEDYIAEVAYTFNTVCESRLLAIHSDSWVLGVPFFQNYYTIFDYENYQIGFAESV